MQCENCKTVFEDHFTFLMERRSFYAAPFLPPTKRVLCLNCLAAWDAGYNAHAILFSKPVVSE